MVFFKLFKKKESSEQKELTIKEVEHAINQELNVLVINETKINKIIQEKLDALLDSLKEKNNHLKTIDVDEIKEREKIKAIVKINLHNYITYVDRLIQKLSNLDSSEHILETINVTFSDFKKKSHVSYEKATYLIGVEMGQIKDTIKQFFNELNLILKENENVLKKVANLKETKKLIILYNHDMHTRSNYQKTLENITKKVTQKKEKIQTLQHKKEEIRSSKEYEKNEEQKQKKEQLSKEIKQELLTLKQLIDFKQLIAIHHSSKKDMEIIHEYQEHFVETCNQKNIDSLKPLLIAANQYKTEFEKKMQEISKKQQEVSSLHIKKIWFEHEEQEIKKLDHEISELEKQTQVIQKQTETLNNSLRDLTLDIQHKAKELGYTILF